MVAAGVRADGPPLSRRGPSVARPGDTGTPALPLRRRSPAGRPPPSGPGCRGLRPHIHRSPDRRLGARSLALRSFERVPQDRAVPLRRRVTQRARHEPDARRRPARHPHAYGFAVPVVRRRPPAVPDSSAMRRPSGGPPPAPSGTTLASTRREVYSPRRTRRYPHPIIGLLAVASPK